MWKHEPSLVSEYDLVHDEADMLCLRPSTARAWTMPSVRTERCGMDGADGRWRLPERLPELEVRERTRAAPDSPATPAVCEVATGKKGLTC